MYKSRGRAKWFLRFLREEINESNVGQLAKELACLLLIINLHDTKMDDDRAKSALDLASRSSEGSPIEDMVERVRPYLSHLQEFLRMKLDALLLGDTMTVDLPARLSLSLVSARGGISCPKGVFEDGGRATLTTGFREASLLLQVQANFMLSIADLPWQAIGTCEHCGGRFLIVRVGNRFCSASCTAMAATRDKMVQIKNDPEKYSEYLAKERKRARKRYEQNNTSGGKPRTYKPRKGGA